MADAPHPDLILYVRAECTLCADAREMVTALLEDRRAWGRAVPSVVERDIDTDADWQRAYFDRVPVLEFGDRRLETVTSLARIRRLLAEVLDGALGLT